MAMKLKSADAVMRAPVETYRVYFGDDDGFLVSPITSGRWMYDIGNMRELPEDLHGALTPMCTNMQRKGDELGGADGMPLTVASGDIFLQARDAGVLVCRPYAGGNVELPGFAGCVRGLLISSDAQIGIASSSDSRVYVWDLKTATLRHRFHHRTIPYGMSASRDFSRLAVGTALNTVIWDLHTGERIHVFSTKDGPVMDVAMSQDGRRVLSTTGTGGILYDCTTHRRLLTLAMPEGKVVSCALSSDCLRIAAVSGHVRVVSLWNVPMEVNIVRPVPVREIGLHAVPVAGSEAKRQKTD